MSATCPICLNDQPVKMDFRTLGEEHECVHCSATYVIVGEDSGEDFGRFSFWSEHWPRWEVDRKTAAAKFLRSTDRHLLFTDRSTHQF